MRAPDVKSILEKVRLFREESSRPVTRELAKVPSSCAFTTIPNAPFLVIPEVSSRRREYVPIGWLEQPTIPSNLFREQIDATHRQIGVLLSRKHRQRLRHYGKWKRLEWGKDGYVGV